VNDDLDGISAYDSPRALPDFTVSEDDNDFHGGEQEQSADNLVPACNSDTFLGLPITNVVYAEGVIDQY
jgi:hypothetical protein